MSTSARDDWRPAIRLLSYSLLATLVYWAGIFFLIVPRLSGPIFGRLVLCALVILYGACALFVPERPVFVTLWPWPLA